MMYQPELETVKQIAGEKKYNIIPVSCEILSDFLTPIETMRILKNVSEHCYMLESAAEKEKWGRYTFLGYDPKLEITCVNGILKAGDERIVTDNPSAYIRQVLAGYKSPKFDYLPSFTGGLVGYFAYDYFSYKEPAVKCEVNDLEELKDVDLMLFDKVIAFDNFRQKLILIVNMDMSEPEQGYKRAIEEIEKMKELLQRGEKKNEPGGRLKGEVKPLSGKEDYCRIQKDRR